VTLYFLRHGKSDPHGSKPDEARQLTESGRAALRAAGPSWRRLGLEPDVVLSSPRQRAIETAELFIAGIGSSTAILPDDRLAPGARWADVAKAIEPHAGAASILLVGEASRRRGLPGRIPRRSEARGRRAHPPLGPRPLRRELTAAARALAR
jgi:phosphohistidine phosphatase